MNWIKRNYDQFILALVALVLLGALRLSHQERARGSTQTFAGILGQVVAS